MIELGYALSAPTGSLTDRTGSTVAARGTLAMNFDQMSRRAAISEELLAHLREDDRVFPDGPRTHATYETAFNGCFRVEVHYGRSCRVAIEHVGGNGAFDWSMAEADRRRPWTKRRWEEGPSEPPTPDEVPYRLEVFEADPEQGRALLEALEALDWGEPTPEGDMGRDGVVLCGSLTTEVGVRAWTTWSPERAVEPAKCVFFQRVLSFAIDHASGSIRSDLELVTPYL